MAHFEILMSPSQKAWAKRAMNSIAENCNSEITYEYKGESTWLVVCGWGGKFVQEAFNKHRARNQPVIVLDMSYLARDKFNYRISVNYLHPYNQLHIANREKEDRLSKHNITMNDWYDPNGHILLLGISAKSCTAYGYQYHQWEREQLKLIKSLYGNRKIVYRPKPAHPSTIPGTIDGSQGDITKWLKGCAVAIVHHSNVAIDCAIHGIPCVASEGIGKQIYPNKLLVNMPLLTKEQRLQFLKQVSWFTWEITESKQMIRFAKRIQEHIK